MNAPGVVAEADTSPETLKGPYVPAPDPPKSWPFVTADALTACVCIAATVGADSVPEISPVIG